MSEVGDLYTSSLPWMVPALLPAAAFFLAPLGGPRLRTVLGGLLLIAGLGFVGDVLLNDHSHASTLQVPNVFPSPPDGDPKLFVVATSTAPAWQWHMVLAVMLAVPGIVLLVRRGRAPAAPSPVLHCAGVFLVYLVTRLGLELTAAPREVCWALGGTPSMVLSLPFFGWYCGQRGLSTMGMTKQLLVLALCERVPLIAIAFFATTKGLGTHLDTHAIKEVDFFGSTKVLEGDAVAAWVWPTVVPHLTIWIILTLVAGLLFASVPRFLAKKRGAAPVSDAAAAHPA